ncbi:hypothetical protein CSB20_11860 [bacterium DOLZORAL124_64_63]|nr:MAG: hypothetical protein CSB20_11860 [bacterium DOLZORAL124_64_63]
MTERRECDLLAAYELNILDQDQRQVFESHLLHCPDCLEEIYAHAPTVTALLREPGFYAETAGRRQTGPSFWRRLAGVFGRQPARVLVPLAMAALLIWGIFLPHGLPSRGTPSPFPGMALTDAPAYSVIAVRAGSSADWQPHWEEGMKHYVAQDYAAAVTSLRQAIPLLEQAAAANRLQRRHLDNARFYLGASLMLAGDTDAAAAALEAAAGSHLPPLRQKSLWYLAQTHLLQDDPVGALAVLAQLQDSPLYGDRARDQAAAIRSAR